MKIQLFSQLKYKLLKLQLIKSKVYKTKNSNNFSLLKKIEIYLKQTLQIIYKFHTNNKQILFVGFQFPKILKKITQQKTKHLVISDLTWVNGILSNKTSVFRFLNLKRLKQIKNKSLKTEELSTLLGIKDKPDLIVVFTKTINNNILNDIYKARIPLVLFNNDVFKNKSTYLISNTLSINRQKFLNLFFLCLFSIFKKVIRVKKSSL